MSPGLGQELEHTEVLGVPSGLGAGGHAAVCPARRALPGEFRLFSAALIFGGKPVFARPASDFHLELSPHKSSILGLELETHEPGSACERISDRNHMTLACRRHSPAPWQALFGSQTCVQCHPPFVGGAARRSLGFFVLTSECPQEKQAGFLAFSDHTLASASLWPALCHLCGTCRVFVL